MKAYSQLTARLGCQTRGSRRCRRLNGQYKFIPQPIECHRNHQSFLGVYFGHCICRGTELSDAAAAHAQSLQRQQAATGATWTRTGQQRDVSCNSSNWAQSQLVSPSEATPVAGSAQRRWRHRQRLLQQLAAEGTLLAASLSASIIVLRRSRWLIGCSTKD